MRTATHPPAAPIQATSISATKIVTTPASPAQLSLGQRVSAYLALTKPRIIELLLVTTVPTMFLAARGVPPLWTVMFTLLGGALAAGGANAFNMYLDRDIDQVMKRTSRRPLVTGVIQPRQALIFASCLEALAAALLWWLVNPLSAVLAVSATAFYVFVYTIWLKRTSTNNIVIGGAAGAVPTLVGWAAVTGSLGWAPVVLFVIIFVWTPPHFWALAIRYREDYAAASVPMLPVVSSLHSTARQIVGYSSLVWATSLVLAPVAGLGQFYVLAATALGATFVFFAMDLLRESTPARAMRLFRYSISYLTLLFLAVALDSLLTYGRYV